MHCQNWGRWGRISGVPRLAKPVIYRLLGKAAGDEDGYADDSPSDWRPPINHKAAEELDPVIGKLASEHKAIIQAEYYLTGGARRRMGIRAPTGMEVDAALRALRDKLDA